ncbi:MAG: hypothetical protein HOV82_17000 [Streptomyces sp.]|nr:hypothetical protein [Streptomyces sp.]NUP36211.1 hypothetical protein [Streptomyces sp.]NUS75558.1 hypothetical protein [Streptomyces sp.]
MAGSGPQKYPGASTAYFYQNRYGGDVMEVNVVVLHTTEGRTLPDYGGGAMAPNLTAVPDFANKQLRWFQHFDIDRSSRALVNLAGGVETNTLNVCQVELVGTCDPKTHAAWGSAPHIYWPEAPDWALAELAEFLRWMHAEHEVPLTGPSEWPAYPASYGATSARMTAAEWNAFEGICGHLHVTENDHGDPGAIDFPKLIALAKGQTVPEEDDMQLSDLVKLGPWVPKKWPKDSGLQDGTIQVNTALGSAYGYSRLAAESSTALVAQVAALTATVGKLAEGGGLDAGEIQAAAEAGAQAALDRLSDALKEG